MEHNNEQTVSILIPTYNAGKIWIDVLRSINKQNYTPAHKIIVDSGSTDNTVQLAEANGFKVVKIEKKDFNHGSTRQLLIDMATDADLCIFLTQDAILASPDSVGNLLKVFDDTGISIAYGRQLPHANAKTMETHARLFNYPETSYIRTLADKEKYGFKTIFCSDSFSAYRKKILMAVGGFPLDTIMGEDTIAAAKMLVAGYKIAYVADATVYHSHSYTIVEEFKRYFDTGVFHTQNSYLKREFGKADGEGVKFVKSEISYIIKHNIILLPYLAISILSKWFGYKLGSKYQLLNPSVVKKLSMHRSYWKTGGQN